MTPAAGNTGFPECSGDAASEGDGGAVVVVGVKLDARSKELLTWALVKVANSGDRVVALYVLDPGADVKTFDCALNKDKTSMLSLVKTFDSVLAAYEGFCNLKQVDLKLKVCRGSPVRKILCREVKSRGATGLVVGTSKVQCTLRSKISLAKSCAKNLPKNVSVICVDNGKIVFQRDFTAPFDMDFRSLDALESRFKKRKTLSRRPLSLPPQRASSSSSSGSENISMSSGNTSMALVPCKIRKMAIRRSVWALLRRKLLHGIRGSEDTSAKRSSVMQWLLKLPRRQSVAAVYPDQRQLSASNRDDCCSHLEEERDSVILYSAGTNSDAYSNKIFSELRDLQEKYLINCQLFTFQELTLATNNFIPEHLIGKGGSSLVYKGCLLPGSKERAVKILKPSNYVLEHFVSEIEILTSLHHKNIISLVGFSFDEDRLLLVYNLLSRGCLEEKLHGNAVSQDLAWAERYKIALGIAEALDALHNTAEPIIHRDVKSSNILLSDDFEPQLSDFGLATWASNCSHDMDTSDVAGTLGYLAPEYFMHGKLNEKIDVYAFGVVLLELLSGRKPIDNGLPKGQESLVMWARHILKEGKVSELQDPSLADACDDNQFENLVLAATLCIRQAPQFRPNINLVLRLLHGDSDVVEWAREVAKYAEDINGTNNEQSATDMQSFTNLALLDLEDETASMSSIEQNVSVEGYLGCRWSRSSSFD